MDKLFVPSNKFTKSRKGSGRAQIVAGKAEKLITRSRGSIRYTQDGSEPREGTPYEGAITIGNEDALLRVFAEADRLEAKNDFHFPAKGKRGAQVNDVKPGRIVSAKSPRKLDSRTRTFEGLQQAGEKSATFEGVMLTIGQGSQVIAIQIGEIEVEAAFIQSLLSKAQEKLAPDAPITMTFRKANFASGHDLKAFADKLGIELQPGDVEQ